MSPTASAPDARQTFLAHWSRSAPLPSWSEAQWDSLLATWRERTGTAHPRIKISFADFLAHAARVVSAQGPEAVAQLNSLHVEDLYLACACTRGDEEALRTFEAQLLPKARAAIRSVRAVPTFVEDAEQFIKHRLLVPEPGATARIGGYTGRGPLSGWVRAAAVRSAINLSKASGRETANEDAGGGQGDLAMTTGDPELEYLKNRYREEFRAAFEAALRALPLDSRNLLRLSVLDGLQVEEIAQVYKSTRSTVYRWLSQAREELYEKTFAELGQRLSLKGSEVESVVRLLRSQLDVSIRRVLDEEEL